MTQTPSSLPVALTNLAANIPQVHGAVVGRIRPPACRVDTAQVPDVVMNETGSYRERKKQKKMALSVIGPLLSLLAAAVCSPLPGKSG